MGDEGYTSNPAHETTSFSPPRYGPQSQYNLKDTTPKTEYVGPRRRSVVGVVCLLATVYFVMKNYDVDATVKLSKKAVTNG
jgi:hypothetical protein